jgi:hypothetical protein
VVNLHAPTIHGKQTTSHQPNTGEEQDLHSLPTVHATSQGGTAHDINNQQKRHLCDVPGTRNNEHDGLSAAAA